MSRIRNTPARYEIGKAHETLIPEIQAAINNTMVSYNETEIVRLALEEFWKRATKKKRLPNVVMKFHKIYNSDDGL
jgi:predicted solute-binding protein